MSRPWKIPRFTVREFKDDGEVVSCRVPLLLDSNLHSTADSTKQRHQRTEEQLLVDNQQQQVHVHEEEEYLPATSRCSPWTALHQQFVDVHFEEHISECAAASCINKIGQYENHIRCKDCGSQTYYCSIQCCKQYHTSDCNPFHKPLLWEVLKNKYTDVFIGIEFQRPNHSCGNQHPRNGIQVFDHLGRSHVVSVVVCGCEKDVITFFRHGLWASSVEQPTVAFHRDLMDTLEYMMIEGKMSLHAFCQSIRWKNHLTLEQSNRFYTCLRGDPIGHYRYFKYLTRTLPFLNMEELTGEEHWRCLACPQDAGDVFVSLDANFGLVRKKGSGQINHEPNHKKGFFIATPDEDEYDSDTEEFQECSNFQAGRVLRSSTKNSKLDVTGVFGAACRHGVAVALMDMKHGESLCLSEAMMEHLLSQVYGQEINLHILYDIACKLHARLKNNGDPRFAGIQFAVPSFHVYGHKAKCQVEYSTRWQNGYGLTDGEVMERLWAFLRRFCFISKEMTASNRNDLLNDALMHYKCKKHAEIDHTLVRNLQKATNVLEMTTEDLRKSTDTLSITIEEVDKLVKDHQDSLTDSSTQGSPTTQKEHYVQLLLKHAELEKKHGLAVDMDTQQDYQDQLQRLEKEICKIEKKIPITRRWSKSDRRFKKHHQSYQVKRKLQLLHKMHDNAVEYEFIVNLKKKYVGERNQKIAQRLHNQIQRASKAVKRIGNQFNQAGFAGNCGGIPDTVVLEELIHPDATVYHHVYGTQQDVMIRDISISSATRHNVAELRVRQLRAVEEQEMTRQEMRWLLNNLALKHEKLLESIDKLTNDASKGVLVVLFEKLKEVAARYYRARELFEKHLPVLPDIPEHLLSEQTVHLTDKIADHYLGLQYPSSDNELSDNGEDDEDDEDDDSII